MAREVLQWKQLYSEVVTSGLCTGCAGCVVACPHDVLGYDDREAPGPERPSEPASYKPFHLEEELGPDNCVHGEKGCTSCTRACPRFRSWETEIDTHLFGRLRTPEEVDGVSKDIILARAADPKVAEIGQDGGLVSAILIWALEHGYIDAALVSYLEGDG
ncbi:MAG: coenzyme F420 hydrogenase/dehydrogenase beta subunit N-terminal domain-containing protein, partial [Acidimicrobiales bacterium]